jgi:hypothetical protein
MWEKTNDGWQLGFTVVTNEQARMLAHQLEADDLFSSFDRVEVIDDDVFDLIASQGMAVGFDAEVVGQNGKDEWRKKKED